MIGYGYRDVCPGILKTSNGGMPKGGSQAGAPNPLRSVTERGVPGPAKRKSF